jgi:DNA-binding NarL/FixJ family response regulator
LRQSYRDRYAASSDVDDGDWYSGLTSCDMMGRFVRELVRTLSLVRVLLVEDFEPFRRFIHTTLQTELQIIAEVSDGLEAVSKAEELQPDLILLDIGLPTLNGIEAARQIHLLSPRSKILFVSQESSADVIEEAMNSGAHGYVVKAHAATDLLDAVEAVCQGRKFVSGNGLSGHFTQP